MSRAVIRVLDLVEERDKLRLRAEQHDRIMSALDSRLKTQFFEGVLVACDRLIAERDKALAELKDVKFHRDTQLQKVEYLDKENNRMEAELSALKSKKVRPTVEEMDRFWGIYATHPKSWYDMSAANKEDLLTSVWGAP